MGGEVTLAERLRCNHLKMGLKNFRRIPVMERGRLVGMLSSGDINRGLFFEKGMRPG